MLEDKLRETDWELTQDTIEEQVLPMKKNKYNNINKNNIIIYIKFYLFHF